MICTKVIQRMVETLAVVPDKPESLHGETTVSPMPVPSRIMIIEKTVAPTAPANTAPQETALASRLVPALSNLGINMSSEMEAIHHPRRGS